MTQFTRIAAAATMLAFASAALADLNRVGPTNVPSPPGHGFPLWYQDLNGMVLDLCIPTAATTNDPQGLQETACLLGPPAPPLPYTFPTQFPDELFYHRVVSDPLTVTGGGKAVLVLAVEAAFGSGVPQAGQQMVFARIRVTSGVPHDGTYTVTHPYGTETFENVVSTGSNRDIFFTEDIGITPGNFTDALTSRVGPFLQHVEDTLIDPATGLPFVPFPGGPAAQPLVLPFDPVTGFIPGVSRYFLGDGVTSRYITGSPFGTNYFEICGPFDGPGTNVCHRQNLFTITGMLHDPNTPVGSPLSVTRATFNRTDGASQVDVMARASQAPGGAAPKLTAAGQAVSPVLMAGPTVLGDWYAQGIPVPSTDVPTSLTVTNSSDAPPTSITTHVTDEITIRSAVYSSGTLTVVATSSDKGDSTVNPVIPPSTLSLAGYPTATRTASNPNDRAEVTFVAAAGPVPPAFVRVTSNHGALATLDTSLAAMPAYPAGVPFVGDDTAEVIQNTAAAIGIDVLANDVAPAGAPINSGTLTIVPPLPAIGTASVSSGLIFYRAPTVTGTAVIRYTVQNAVGTSNVGTVNVAVLADPNGPVPTAVNDPSTGAINATAGAPVTINVLANDSANGGTLNPASVTIVSAAQAGITTTVNTTTGAVTFTSTTAGTKTFQYTVSNLPSANGTIQTSAPATVTVTVATAENLTVRTPIKCSLPNKWQIQGTSNISTGNTITIYKGSTASGTIIGTAPVVNGAWQFQGLVTCSTPVSFKSTLGTTILNQPVQIK